MKRNQKDARQDHYIATALAALAPGDNHHSFLIAASASATVSSATASRSDVANQVGRSGRRSVSLLTARLPLRFSDGGLALCRS
jgi:hypothetical protein